MYKTKFLNSVNVVLIMLVISSAYACTKVIDPVEADFGFEFYPTQIGDYRIYYTKTIRYKLDGSIDTTEYLVKEMAEDSVVYTNGQPRILLGRYSSNLSTIKWKKDSLWAVLITSSNVILSEANIDYVKLSFPVVDAEKWDGNATNSKEEELYELIDLGNAYSYDTLSYKNTLTVVHKDLFDPAKITEDDYRMEVFAANIGLIHKLNIKINYCSSCVENGKIDDGFIFEQKLIEFGKE